MNKTAIIIPSHLASERLPNKPLLEINNKPMIYMFGNVQKNQMFAIYLLQPQMKKSQMKSKKMEEMLLSREITILLEVIEFVKH